MQIDFHHTVTYVVARLAGMDHEKAEIVAYSAQYVDDCTSSGIINFSNKAIYERISSAHKLFDLRNLLNIQNRGVWLPFHFLPGNNGRQPGEEHDEGSFVKRLVCLPDSPLAKEMVRSAILDKEHNYSYHRLGITLHVYADTWAHQNFAGVLHNINEVDDVEFGNNGGDWQSAGFWQDIADDRIPPLGHGRANTFPDRPFLIWRYRNGDGELIERNNTDIFCQAVKGLYEAVYRFLNGEPDKEVPDFPPDDMAKITNCFEAFTDEDGDKRHEKWLDLIADGHFSFGAQELDYAARGRPSWKHKALGSSYDMPVHKWSEDFISSNWKMFHDAVQSHRLIMLRNILPEYGICAA